MSWGDLYLYPYITVLSYILVKKRDKYGCFECTSSYTNLFSTPDSCLLLLSCWIRLYRFTPATLNIIWGYKYCNFRLLGEIDRTNCKIAILVNNQLDALLQCIYLFHFSTCFEQPSAHHRENQFYQYIIWLMSLCVGDCLVCRSGIPDSHLHRVMYW